MLEAMSCSDAHKHTNTLSLVTMRDSAQRPSWPPKKKALAAGGATRNIGRIVRHLWRHAPAPRRRSRPLFFISAREGANFAPLGAPRRGGASRGGVPKAERARTPRSERGPAAKAQREEPPRRKAKPRSDSGGERSEAKRNPAKAGGASTEEGNRRRAPRGLRE